MISGAFALWIELLMREAAVYVIVLMLPLAFAAMVWLARRIWAVRAVELLVALILSKFVIVAVLSLGGAAISASTGHQSVAGVMAGAVLVLLAAFSPWAMLRFVPMAEPASGAAGGLRGEVGRAGAIANDARVLAEEWSEIATAAMRRNAQGGGTDPGPLAQPDSGPAAGPQILPVAPTRIRLRRLVQSGSGGWQSGSGGWQSGSGGWQSGSGGWRSGSGGRRSGCGGRRSGCGGRRSGWGRARVRCKGDPHDVGLAARGSVVTGERLTYRFGPLERRGLFGQLRGGQAAAVAAGAAAAIVVLDRAPSAAGAFLGTLLFAGSLLLAFAPARPPHRRGMGAGRARVFAPAGARTDSVPLAGAGRRDGGDRARPGPLRRLLRHPAPGRSARGQGHPNP